MKDKSKSKSKSKSHVSGITINRIDNEKKKPFWTTRLMAENYGREMVLKTTLIEAAIYLLFLIVVLIATLGAHSSSMYYLTRAMRKQFLETPFRTVNDVEITFSDIRSAADFWAYAESVFSDGFNWDFWYDPVNPVSPTDKDDKKILYENKLLGVPRIRQLKVRGDTCSIHEYFAPQFYRCYGAYTWDNQDTDPFGPEEGTAWSYTSPDDLGGSSYTGKLRKYHAGGYYQDLFDNGNQTKGAIVYLKENLWIQRGTRVIFIDFTVYNANLNLFAVCKIIFEFPPTGGLLPTSNIQTLYIVSSGTAGEIIVIGMSWVLIIFTLFYTAQAIREALYFKWKYFIMFWSYIDITIILLLLAVFICNIRRVISQSSVETLAETERSYASFEEITYVYVTYNNAIAVLAFFTFVKLFKYLSFNKTMGQLNSTLKNCVADVLGFSVMFFIIFFAFAELGYLLFGTKVESFSTFGTSMFTLLRTILGDFDYMEIEQADRILAPIFFLSYIFFVFFVLLNMFLAIINDTYADVKAEIASSPQELQLTRYITRFCRKMCGKKKKHDENDDQKKPMEDNPVIKKIRNTLQILEFTDEQIEMFLEKYEIDPSAEVDEYEIRRLIKQMEKESDDGLPVIKVYDFAEQQQRLRGVERAVRDLAKLTSRLTKKLEHVDKVNKEDMHLSASKTDEKSEIKSNFSDKEEIIKTTSETGSPTQSVDSRSYSRSRSANLSYNRSRSASRSEKPADNQQI